MSDDMMPVDVDQEKMWRLSDDRETVRLLLPPLLLEGLRRPLSSHLDFDAKTIDSVIERLTVLRAQMLPAPRKPGKRSGMREAPSNQWPVNQAALKWLREAKASPDEAVSYVAQLAAWGLEKGLVEISRPMSPSQPEHHDVESAVNSLLGAGWEKAAGASQWFLSNPNMSEEEQADNLVWQLEQAKNPQEAAQVAVEAAYDLMVAMSATFD
jgi:hypothetical protein